MKRIITVLSITLILLQMSWAGVIGSRPNGAVAVTDGMPRIQKRGNTGADRRNPPQQPAQNRTENKISFEKFPVGQPVQVDINIDDSSFSSISDRDEQDQIRDWLLLTTLSGVGLSATQINKITYDLPTIRYGYMQPVARFEYGVTRSASIGRGNVIALIPSSSTDKAKENLSHVADKERMYTGVIPATFNVFQYSIDRRNGKASLSRLDPMKGSDLFTPEYGYFEERVAGLNDLSGLMGKINDVTIVRVDGNALTVGGRKLSSYRGVQIEDAAALWKSDASIREKLRKAEAEVNSAANALEKNLRQKIKDFDERWQPLRDWIYAGGVPNAQVSAQIKQYATEKNQLESEIKTAQTQLAAELSVDVGSRHLVHGSGFSLDPTYDFEGLSRFSAEKLEPKLTETFKDIPGVASKFTREIKDGLARKDVVPLLTLVDILYSLGIKQAEVGQWLDKSIKEYSLQSARYDGELKGTKVGMTLFYTDLLAKLWALDFEGSSPSNKIKNFKSVVETSISPAFQEDSEELPSTRLWFGPQDQGYQIASDGNALLFGRNSTRIYAASSNPLDPGHESQPNAWSARFLGWWDSHYDQVAQYEPEYQRLNEIMKWSLLLGWLDEKSKTGLLSFLGNVNVDSSEWFPDWIKTRPDLTFQSRDDIKFFKPGYIGTKTETMPLLRSVAFNMYGDQDDRTVIGGGVSLGGKTSFEGRKFPSQLGIAEEIIRPNLSAETTRVRIKTTDEVTHDLSAVGGPRSIVKSIANATAKFRDQFGEVLGIKTVERSVLSGNGKTKFETTAGKISIGTLDIAEAPQGFAIGWRGRELAEANSLAQRVSVTGDPEMVFATSPDVETSIRINESNRFIVKLRGSNRLLKLTVDEDSVASHSRIVDFRGDESQVDLTWIENPAFSLNLSGAQYFRFQPLGVKGSAITVDAASAIRPPPGSRSLIIGEGPSHITARFDPDEGAVYISTQQVLSMSKSDYGKIGKLVTASDIKAIRELAKTDGAITYIRPANIGREIEQLRSIDSLIASRKFSSALQAIEEAKQINPSNAGLDLREAVVLIQTGESKTAWESIARIAQGAVKEESLHEINVYLSQFGGNPENGWKEVALAKDGRMDVVQYLKALRKGETVSPQEIDLATATVYVQDDPSLSSYILNGADRRVLLQMISGDLGEAELIKIPRDHIKDVNPTVIYDSGGGGNGTGVKYRLVAGDDPPPSSTITNGTRTGGWIHTTRGWMFVPVCLDDDEDDKNCDKNHNNIYVLRIKPHKKAA